MPLSSIGFRSLTWKGIVIGIVAALVLTAIQVLQFAVIIPLFHLDTEPEQWGWRRIRNRWAAQGRRIGWLASNDLFLDPVASYEAAQQMGIVLVSPQTLRRRLREH